MKRVEVLAHPNVALVKYWGKQDEIEKVPVTPSLSITLGGLETRTTIGESSHDEIIIDGKPVLDSKIVDWLSWLHNEYSVAKLKIESQNNFPASCGFASSSSGFAALAAGVNELCSLKLDDTSLARITRFGSASAVRSLIGGFVVMDPNAEECAPVQLATPENWPLHIIGAVTSVAPKATSSTEGMAHTVATSPFYESWVDRTRLDFELCKQAVHTRDFESLRAISEANCYRMHALMMSSEPPLRYWNAGTLNAIDTIEKLQTQNIPVFFTSDAGPQIKAVCVPEAASTVKSALENTTGVYFTIDSKVGHAPTVSVY